MRNAFLCLEYIKKKQPNGDIIKRQIMNLFKFVLHKKQNKNLVLCIFNITIIYVCITHKASRNNYKKQFPLIYLEHNKKHTHTCEHCNTNEFLFLSWKTKQKNNHDYITYIFM